MATAALTAAWLTPAVAHSAPLRESILFYSYDNAIRETVWVDIGLDRTATGDGDRVAADIVRPATRGRGRKYP